jgi:hypothetical protein
MAGSWDRHVLAMIVVVVWAAKGVSLSETRRWGTDGQASQACVLPLVHGLWPPDDICLRMCFWRYSK